MAKFKNKYRIESVRLPGYDYGRNGAYFITICTANRQCFFGDITEGQMMLNPMGQWADQLWTHIPDQFPFVKLGRHIVMPNHVHGILIIDKPGTGIGRDAINRVSTSRNNEPFPQKNGGFAGDKNPMFHQNVARIIRWYKGRCTYEIRKIHADFAWQSRYHDHIIRNERSYQNISNYIIQNPRNWATDSLKNPDK